MIHESGTISVSTENIFPIIKKWLYSEKDIFVRELVSNSSDAISKLKKLVSIGEAIIEKDDEYYIRVKLDKEKRIIQITDNGIGMTSDEIKKYINQVAFSGVKDFVEKYKDKTDEGQIIGHFGLGFYSAFMVSEKVEIDSLSYVQGSKAVKWVSESGIEYSMEGSDKVERGTTITLYISEDSKEFLDSFMLRGVLEKYFSFLPYQVFFEDVNKEEEETDKPKSDDKSEETPKPINDTEPLWLKNPRDCTDEEYKEFYKKTFFDFTDPLFWIHLNVDYPFKLRGILYFPKLRNEIDNFEGQIKLFYNQVFVADNIKEVIPEFLMLLKGVIDCPDLPLNVSRSFLQNDGYVARISNHITKKVGDKLKALFDTERENYYKYWDDINPFVKFGCIKERKFYDRVKDILIFKTINNEYTTLKDYLEKYKEKHENKVFYVSDENQQAQYIRLFKDNELEAVVLSSPIDNHFIQFIEMNESGVKFQRIDSDLSESMKDSEGKIDEQSLGEISKKLEGLFGQNLGDEKLKIRVEPLKTKSLPGMILLSEESRRMIEMSKMYGGALNIGDMYKEEETLILNSNNNLIKSILEIEDKEGKKDDLKLICEHIYDLSKMSHKPLEPEEMTKFIERSNSLLASFALKD